MAVRIVRENILLACENEDINEKRSGGGLMSIYVKNAYRHNVLVFKSTNRTLIFLLVLCSWSLRSAG
jgi:hypothetical protein